MDKELLKQVGVDEQESEIIETIVSVAAVSLFVLQIRGIYCPPRGILTIGELESGLIFALEAGLAKLVERRNQMGL